MGGRETAREKKQARERDARTQRREAQAMHKMRRTHARTHKRTQARKGERRKHARMPACIARTSRTRTRTHAFMYKGTNARERHTCTHETHASTYARTHETRTRHTHEGTRECISIKWGGHKTRQDMWSGRGMGRPTGGQWEERTGDRETEG